MILDCCIKINFLFSCRLLLGLLQDHFCTVWLWLFLFLFLCHLLGLFAVLFCCMWPCLLIVRLYDPWLLHKNKLSLLVFGSSFDRMQVLWERPVPWPLSHNWSFAWTLAGSVPWHWWLGDRKGIWPVKNWVLVCWWWRFDWSFARLIAPLVTTTSSVILNSNKIQNGDVLVPANPDSSLENGRRALVLAGFYAPAPNRWGR